MQQFERFEPPLRIGVVADTHRPNRRPVDLPAQMLRDFESCDLILHLGDFNALPVLERLQEIAPVRGVYGNNDSAELVQLLPRTHFFEVGRWRFGMLHGHDGGRITAKQLALSEMKGKVDCVFYGHSHWPDHARREGLLMVNPGSATQKRWAAAHTYAIVVVDEEIEVELIELPH